MNTSLDIADVVGAGQQHKSSGHQLKKWLAAAAFILALAIIGRSLYQSTQPDIAAFRIQTATRGSLEVLVTATGTVQPRNEVSVGIEVSGTIAEVFVDHNDFVVAGDRLASLDTTRLEAQAAQSRASLQLSRASELEAKATLTQSESELSRLLNLHEVSSGALPAAQDLEAAQAVRDRAVAALERAKAQVAQSEAQLQVNQTDLENAQVISPIDGIVLTRRIDPGQSVAASFQTPELFVIAEELSEIELSIEIDEADVGLVHEGQSATFTVDAYLDEEFPAEISLLRYAPISNAGVVTYEAILSAENTSLRLRPGMTATASITIEEVNDALLVPNTALRFTPRVQEDDEDVGFIGSLIPRPPGSNAPANIEPQGRQRTLWTLNESGAPEALSVLIGATDGVWTEIVDGDLTEDTQLIIEQLN